MRNPPPRTASRPAPHTTPDPLPPTGTSDDWSRLKRAAAIFAGGAIRVARAQAAEAPKRPAARSPLRPRQTSPGAAAANQTTGVPGGGQDA